MTRISTWAWTWATAAPALVALAAAPARADQPKLIPYTVQKGDACDTVALKVLGDARLTDVVHANNPQLGPRPHHLKEGQILMLPPPSPDARLGFVHNHVEVQARPAQVDEALFRGNRVATGDSSSADMRFRDDSQLSMGERTLVILLGSTSTSVSQPADATLLNGSLRSRLAELAGKKSVATPGAAVSLGAGEAQLSVDDKGATRLAVYQGKSALTAQMTTVRVNEGYGSKAVKGLAPTPPRPLPPAPAWSSPPPPIVLTTGRPVEVAGDFARGQGPGPDVAQWHVELARDEHFHDPLVDNKVVESVTRLEAKEVTPGVYFARVSAIDADAFEGPWGATRKVAVVRVDATDLGNHYGSFVPSRTDVTCGVDGGPLVAGPVEVDRVNAHVVGCALASDPSQRATLAVPADDLGTLTLHARWLELDEARHEGEAVLDLVDGAVRPFSRGSAQITSPGLAIMNAERAAEPGRYFVKVRWSASVPLVHFHLVFGNLVADSNDIPLTPP